MRERVRKEKYYRQEEHDPEFYRNIINPKKIFLNFYCCTVNSDIYTVHSPKDAHLLKI
jgi:hypothetical protein